MHVKRSCVCDGELQSGSIAADPAPSNCACTGLANRMKAPMVIATRPGLRVEIGVIPLSSVGTESCRHRDRNPSMCIAPIEIRRLEVKATRAMQTLVWRLSARASSQTSLIPACPPVPSPALATDFAACGKHNRNSRPGYLSSISIVAPCRRATAATRLRPRP